MPISRGGASGRKRSQPCCRAAELAHEEEEDGDFGKMEDERTLAENG